MAKDTFIIYKSFYKPISRLSDKQLGRLFRAIFKYHIDGEATVEEDIEMAFEFFKNQFEIDESKYQGIVERNRSNGRNGVKARSEKQSKKANGSDRYPNKPVGAKKANGSLNDNDNDNDINISFPKVKDTSVSGETDGEPQEKNLKEDIDFDKLLQFFNSQVEIANASIAKIFRMTPERCRLVNCRCREYGKEAIETVILNAVTSDFLNGTKTDFVADFNWLFKPRNFLKVLEGAYNSKPRYENNTTNRTAGQWSGRNGVQYKGAVDFDCGLVEPTSKGS